MQLGIFAKTFAGDHPADILAMVAACGFGTTQYNMACSGLAAMPATLSPKVVADIQAASKATRVSIAAVSGTYNMIHPDAGLRMDGHKKLETLARACAAMGTNLITLCTGTRNAEDQWSHHPDNATPEAWADLCRSFAVAVEIADRYNINLGVEPELANVVSSASKAKQLISDMQSNRIKIIFDAANLFEVATLQEQHSIVSESLALLGEHIMMAHAKDRMPSGEFATAGQGCLDYDHYLKELQNAGFSGPLITHGLKAQEAASVAVFLKAKCAKIGITIL